MAARLPTLIALRARRATLPPLVDRLRPSHASVHCSRTVDSHSAALADTLHYRLTACNDLHLSFQHVHWNAAGPNFITVHEVPGQQVELTITARPSPWPATSTRSRRSPSSGRPRSWRSSSRSSARTWKTRPAASAPPTTPRRPARPGPSHAACVRDRRRQLTSDCVGGWRTHQPPAWSRGRSRTSCRCRSALGSALP